MKSKAIVDVGERGWEGKGKWRVHFRLARKQEPRKDPPSHRQTALKIGPERFELSQLFQGQQAMTLMPVMECMNSLLSQPRKDYVIEIQRQYDEWIMNQNYIMANIQSLNSKSFLRKFFFFFTS